MTRAYRGRLAPSPTGFVHLGTARTSLLAYVCARHAGGELVLRMEDLDPPRVVPGAAEAIVEDLRWLGLDWDEGPDVGGPHAPYVQSERSALYEAALETLRAKNLLFACSCTRKELSALASAPHGDLPARYPGTCLATPARTDRPHALRMRMRAGEGFIDRVHGPIAASEGDDFVVRRADGLFAYQLAVVVDDLAMGITEVVRGDDLLDSTPRQIALYRALGASVLPDFAHVPLVLGPDGARLAKRHGAISLREHRERGVKPERIVGALAASLGLAPQVTECTPRELVSALAQAPLELETLQTAQATVMV